MSRSEQRSAASRSWPGGPTTPVSVDFPTEAYNFGHGKNIVNVTLVDIRAWDTLGEVSVLVAAATGIASLIFVRTRNTRLSRATAKSLPASNARGTWLLGGRTMRKEKRSVIFEEVTRLVFHIMLAASLYLLFAGHNQPGGGFAGGRRPDSPRRALSRRRSGRARRGGAFDAGLLVGLGRPSPSGPPGTPRVRGHDPRDHGRRLHPVALG